MRDGEHGLQHTALFPVYRASRAEEAWPHFRGWRVNYDQVLIELCDLVVAPPAKWSSDRKPAEAVRVRVWRRNVLGR